MEAPAASNDLARPRVSLTSAVHAMSSTFDCSICLRLMHEPATLPCGHSFCKTCLRTCLEHSLCCPTCRMDVPSEMAEPQVNIALSEALEQLNPTEATARREEAATAPVRETPAGLPSFPLFVLEPLLPGQVMTLHVFEPRYIRLTQRALSEPRLQCSFGMVCGGLARQSGISTHGVEAKILEHSDAGGGRSCSQAGWPDGRRYAAGAGC